MVTRKDAEHALVVFGELFGAKYPTAVDCLEKDREQLLAFHDFPAEHWTHLRTTNPIESTFATVRLRTARTKGSGSAKACLAMVFKLALAAQRNWRKLNAATLLADVITGVPPRRINEIVHRRRSVTADTALRLGMFFGTTPEFWLNLQALYDLETLRDRSGDEIAAVVRPLVR